MVKRNGLSGRDFLYYPALRNQLIVSSIILFLMASGCVQEQQQEKTTTIIQTTTTLIQPTTTIPTTLVTTTTTLPALPEKQPSGGLQLAMASYYRPVAYTMEPNVPQYRLPLDLDSIDNFDTVSLELGLGDTGKNLIQNNGFVVIDYGRQEDIVQPYKDLKAKGIPVFVTSDTLLHLYHIQFDETLKDVEEREFFDDITVVSETLMEKSMDDYQKNTGVLKEAARRNTAYFAVGLKLLKPDASIPDYVKNEVDYELEKIEAHTGFAPSAIFKYKEDYSQYVPRGHYTRSENLKKYFKSMMWYGRIGFLLKGCPKCAVSEEDARIQTIQAALMTTYLNEKTKDRETIGGIWDRMYAVTAYFVGLADDLTLYEYNSSLYEVLNKPIDLAKLEDDNNLLEFKASLVSLRSPKIYGGTGECRINPPITPEKLDKCLDESKGLRFMGQRYIPDSYMFQQFVAPTTGMYTGSGTPFTMCQTQAGKVRCFPRGLDVMYILGSQRALEILESEGDTDYEFYDNQSKMLLEEFNSFNKVDWNRNLYWSWLYTLKPLLKESDANYPTFMQSKTWQDKELNTALASWTELRHDTILYAKQSYTPMSTGIIPIPKPIAGYIEPVPEFYSRLLSLTRMTREGLDDLQVLNDTSRARLVNLEGLLERMLNISVRELENQELSEGDYDFIRNFGENLEGVVLGVEETGTKTTLVADAHTDTNTGQVLEEGVGYVDIIIVAYRLPDGRILVGAGPVMSYYEFKHPMEDRLTDERWRELLVESPPGKPEWTGYQ